MLLSPSQSTLFLVLRKPEAEALTPEDFDAASGLVRIHTHTKTKNDETLPVIPELRRILAAGWNRVNLRKAERAIVKTLKGTSLDWRGWYAFRRGMLTNLWRLKVPVEEACLILRNSPEVCRKHYLVLDATVSKQGAMDTLQQAYEDSATVIQ